MEAQESTKLKYNNEEIKSAQKKNYEKDPMKRASEGSKRGKDPKDTAQKIIKTSRKEHTEANKRVERPKR